MNIEETLEKLQGVLKKAREQEIDHIAELRNILGDRDYESYKDSVLNVFKENQDCFDYCRSEREKYDIDPSLDSDMEDVRDLGDAMKIIFELDMVDYGNCNYCGSKVKKAICTKCNKRKTK